VAAISDIIQRLERDPRTQELVERPHAIHTKYTATLEDVKGFASAIWTLAVEHQVPQADDS
jgi:hypothetical protein